MGQMRNFKVRSISNKPAKQASSQVTVEILYNSINRLNTTLQSIAKSLQGMHFAEMLNRLRRIELAVGGGTGLINQYQMTIPVKVEVLYRNIFEDGIKIYIFNATTGAAASTIYYMVNSNNVKTSNGIPIAPGYDKTLFLNTGDTLYVVGDPFTVDARISIWQV